MVFIPDKIYHMYGQTENRKPISHLAKAGMTKMGKNTMFCA